MAVERTWGIVHTVLFSAAPFSVFVDGVEYALDNDKRRSGCNETRAGFESEQIGEVIMNRIPCRNALSV